LRDEGYLQFDEPFLKMLHQGMILGPDGKKMSKSKGNVINPDDVIEKFGADSLRMYEMFMGPIEADKPWSMTSMMGVYRFLQRLQNTFDEELSAVGEPVATGTMYTGLQQKLHSTLEKMTTDVPLLKINTAIASLMELLNTWEAERRKANGTRLFADGDLSLIARMIAPVAPFLAEEMWSHVPGAVDSVHLASWPHFDKMLAKPASVIIPVQINGKVRAKLTVSQDQLIEHASILEQALAHPDVQKYTEGKTINKQLYIAGKIVSLAVK
jgi:leucyl-tRNA synthetase